MITETYSVLLLTVCGAAVTCGFYAVHDSVTRLSRLFSAICATLAVQAFDLAPAGAVRTEEICFAGRRTVPLGWGIIGSLTMHAALLLTGRKGLLRKRWLFFLIYLPAAVSVYTYAVPPLFDRNPGTLAHTEHDWVNTSKTGGWDWFYYIHTVLYAVVTVVLLLRWGWHSTSNDEKKQTKIISFFFFFAAVLGYTTSVLSVFFHIRFPQVAATFALVMIFAIGYCTNRYRFLQPVAISQNKTTLSKSACTNVYLCLGLVLFVGAYPLLTDRSFYTGHQNVILVQVASGLLVLLGIFLASIEHLRLENNAKEMLISLSFALVVPFYAFWFTDGGILIAWPFVFLFMIICLLLGRFIILSATIVATFLTQLFAWGYTPSEVIVLSGGYYLDRIGVIVLTAIFVMYVGRIYTIKFQEDINHVTMQFIVSDISRSFVSSGGMNIDQKLYTALEGCGHFIECDRICLILVNMQTNTIRYAVE